MRKEKLPKKRNVPLTDKTHRLIRNAELDTEQHLICGAKDEYSGYNLQMIYEKASIRFKFTFLI